MWIRCGANTFRRTNGSVRHTSVSAGAGLWSRNSSSGFCDGLDLIGTIFNRPVSSSSADYAHLLEQGCLIPIEADLADGSIGKVHNVNLTDLVSIN